MTHRELYELLPDGQKARIRRRFTDLHSCTNMTFYRKLAGLVKVRKAEKQFFDREIGPGE